MSPYAVPGIQKMYGNWEVDLELLVIRWQDKDSAYCWEFDLERMSSSAQILDMVMQANTHRDAIFTNADIGDLVEAIEHTLYPQGNYCSFGVEKMTHQGHIKLMKSLSTKGELVNLKD